MWTESKTLETFNIIFQKKKKIKSKNLFEFIR